MEFIMVMIGAASPFCPEFYGASNRREDYLHQSGVILG
jgi:hypothetical protein